ncbi:MAG: TSUP family transporter [Pseudomonadota bacterium]
MLEDATTLLILLAMAAFLAGFIDAIAGGGGLITVPALVLAGLPPVEALGTNKLQGLFGTGAAAINYSRKGYVDLKQQWPSALIAGGASVIGAGIATIVPADWFRAVLPFLLVAIALFFWLKPGLDDTDKAARIAPALFIGTLVPLLGFYDGLFGPGTGSFFMLGFVTLAGYGVLKATAHTKLLNFASNVGGLIFFAFAGAVAWKIGLAMAVAQIAGARVGSSLAMRRGAGLIKPLLVITCAALAVRLWMN